MNKEILKHANGVYKHKAKHILTTSGQNVQEILDNIWAPFKLTWEINIASDFPTLADVKNGWTYTIKADVVDNDPTKTNTSQAFSTLDIVAWNGTNWTDITGIEVFKEDWENAKTHNPNLNIDLQNGGLKDSNVTTAVKLWDSSNTSLNTTNKTILGAINENKSKTDNNSQDIDILTETISNLASANWEIKTTTAQTITTTENQLTFEISQNSSDLTTFEFDATNNYITFKKAGNYNFTSTLNISSTTPSTVNIDFNLRKTSDDSIVKTQNTTITISPWDSEGIPLNTLLVLTDTQVPLTIKINKVADINWLTIDNFQSILATSNTVQWVKVHNELTSRDANDSHTISAITNLQTELNSKITKVTSTDDAIVRFDGVTGEVQDSNVFIDNSGNIWIWTATPAEKLHIISWVNNIWARFDSSDTLSLIAFRDNATTDVVLMWAEWNNAVFYAWATSSEKMRIDGSGNVGIGTSTPIHQIHNTKWILSNSVYIWDLDDWVDFSDRWGNWDNLYIRQPVRTTWGWWWTRVEIADLEEHTSDFWAFDYIDKNWDWSTIRKFGVFKNGNIETEWFTKLWENAPKIKTRKYTGTTPASTWLQTLILSGTMWIDIQKIVSYEVLIEPTSYENHWFKEWSLSATELFTTYIDPNRIAINISGSNITSANYKLFITYEEEPMNAKLRRG